MQKSMRDQSRIVVHAKFEYAPKVHFISTSTLLVPPILNKIFKIICFQIHFLSNFSQCYVLPVNPLDSTSIWKSTKCNYCQSHYIKVAQGTKNVIWAGFGPGGNTEKKLGQLWATRLDNCVMLYSKLALQESPPCVTSIYWLCIYSVNPGWTNTIQHNRHGDNRYNWNTNNNRNNYHRDF